MPVIENPIGLELDNIVLATDFTPESRVAEQYAHALAGRFYSKVTVANVVDLTVTTPVGSPVVGTAPERLRQRSAEEITKVVASLRDAGIRVEGTTLEAHTPGSAIVGLARKVHANLIVMGTGATRGLGKWILGSCAEGVIHHARCPVVTVGPRVKKLKTPALVMQNIVFATDLKHDVSVKAAVALTFAKDSVSHIYMCHVLDHAGEKFGSTLEAQVEAENTLRKLMPKPAYEWCSPKYIVECGRVGEHVLQLAKKVNADLIVMGAHRDVTWFTHLSEGVIGRVLAEAECPVMTICTD